jgi:hypothetical protein
MSAFVRRQATAITLGRMITGGHIGGCTRDGE